VLTRGRVWPELREHQSPAGDLVLQSAVLRRVHAADPGANYCDGTAASVEGRAVSGSVDSARQPGNDCDVSCRQRPGKICGHRKTHGGSFPRPNYGDSRIVGDDRAEGEDQRRRLLNTAQTHRVVIIQDREKPVTMGLPRPQILSDRSRRNLARQVYQRWRGSMAVPDLDGAAGLEEFGGNLGPAQPARLGAKQRNQRRMLVKVARYLVVAPVRSGCCGS